MGAKELSAKEIRANVQRRYIEPTRQRGEKKVTIRAGDMLTKKQ